MAEGSRLKTESSTQNIGLLSLVLIVLTLFYLNVDPDGPAVWGGTCDDEIYMQVEGDIRYPGVYPFCQEGDLIGLIERAGGLEPPDHIPPAFNDIPLEKGTKVTLKRDRSGWGISRDRIPAFHSITLGIPISINRESEEGLTAIPGIGPKLARAIVMERGKRGGFKSLDEITDVYGIGDKVYENIFPYITL
jgi:competence protein ComEA